MDREKAGLGVASVCSALVLIALIGLFAYGCHEHSLTEREAMKAGYISDRGEWRKP